MPVRADVSAMIAWKAARSATPRSSTRIPPDRARFTYWRHLPRSAPHRAASSGARSITRVTLGWTSGAGRQPSALKRLSRAPVGVVRAVDLDLGVDPQVRDPLHLAGAPTRTRSVNADRLAASQLAASGPRGA